MLPASLVLAIICDPASGETSRRYPILELNVENLTVAPTIAPLPANMPLPMEAPDDGHWCGSEGRTLSLGTFLPAPLNYEIHRRQRMLERIPEAFQLQLDKLVQLKDNECNGRIEVAEARCKADGIIADIQTESGHQTLHVILWAVGAFAFGAIAGAVFYAIGR